MSDMPLVRLRLVAVVSGLATVLATGAAAQAPLSITPGFDGGAWIAPSSPIELRLSQPLPPAIGRLAVLIGVTDITALFAVLPDRLVYQPGLMPLPDGESAVIAYLVTPADDWKEVGRFPIRVRTGGGGGFELSEFGIKVGADLNGQGAEGHTFPGDAPLRSQYQDLTLHINEHSAHVTSTWSLRSQSNLLAAGYRRYALRFGELADRAPLVDLSDYLVEGERDHGTLSLGHIAFGGNRFLLNNFASRGVMVAESAGPARISLAAMNGTSIVGWSNPIGLAHPDHRLLAAELGLEAVPGRPGALGMQVSLLDGWQLPFAGVSQGVVADAERSRGVGFHLSASDAAQRVRLDAGYARSQFANPADPSLWQGFSIVPLERTTRNARYADVTVDVLRSMAVPQTVAAALVATYRHERVDPLYRSVANPAVADLLQNSVEVTAGVGPLSAQLSHGRSHDNLDGIPTLLTTLTRATGANLMLPLAPLFRAPQSPWLPAISYGLNTVHQWGDHLPPNSGFSLGDIPDQASTNHNLGVQWSSSAWHAGYLLGRSSQDNRQVGLEASDFSAVTHAVSLGVTPVAFLDLAFDVALEAARNEEVSQEIRTRRASGLLNWRFTRTTALAATLSATRTADDPRTIEQSNTDARLELSQRINLPLKPANRLSGQLFLRYTRQGGNLSVPGVPASGARPKWVFNTGVALSVL